MVLGVFGIESARRSKCHVPATLRHVRRLEFADSPKNAPTSAHTGRAKRMLKRAKSAAFGVGGTHPDQRMHPHRIRSRVHQNPEPQGATPRKAAFFFAKKKQKKANRPLESNQRPQRLQDSHKRQLQVTTRRFCHCAKIPPLPPTTLVLFVVVWHAYICIPLHPNGLWPFTYLTVRLIALDTRLAVVLIRIGRCS